jgi:hypothetical protein
VAQEILPERCWGWLVMHEWSAVIWYPTWRRPLCWEHLQRDITAARYMWPI